MKYVVIIIAGAADLPLEELGDRTPLEAAKIPNLDALAIRGRVGSAFTSPVGFEAGSDVCSMSLLGYDPAVYFTGRAPLEALAMGLNLTPNDWVFRLNLVTVGHEGDEKGLLLDHSAGAITSREAKALVTDLMSYWKSEAPDLVEGMTATAGTSYRNILVDSSSRDYRTLRTVPPQSILDESWSSNLPSGSDGGATLRKLMELSADFLPKHEVNLARVEQGLRPANMAWIWGQGNRPVVPSFQSRFGMKGAMITPVDLLAGIAASIGWDRVDCPGLSSYHDNDYAAQGRATIEALRRYDIVCCHVESPAEASHQGDWETKVASLEAIDKDIIGPVVDVLDEYGDPQLDPQTQGFRILVMPDHFTLCSTRRHHDSPVPFVMAGAWIRSVVERPFAESAAEESDLRIDPGHELMEYFLRGGLAAVRAQRSR